MSSPQSGPSLGTPSESAQQTGPETSSVDEPALQPDSTKHKDMPATLPPQKMTDSESHEEARESEHQQAVVQPTKTEDDETHTPINSNSSSVDGSSMSQTDPRRPNSQCQSLPTSPILVPETQPLDSVATPQEDPLDGSNASLALCEASELTQSTAHNVVDLTQDGPYDGTRLTIQKEPVKVKQEPPIGLSNTKSVTDTTLMHQENQMVPGLPGPDETEIGRAPEPTGPDEMDVELISGSAELDKMEIDALPSDNYNLPELEGGNITWESSPEDRAEETEDTLAILQTAGKNFWASLPVNEHSHPIPAADNLDNTNLIDIDSETEDAMAVATFQKMKKAFLTKKKSGKIDMADEVEYKRAQQAEIARKRRRARNHARRASPELEDQSMFFSDDGQPAQPSLSGKGNGRGRGKPRGSKTVAKGGIHKTTNKRQRPSTMNFGSLFRNDIIAIAQENQNKESQPTFTSTNKAKALSELISSMPKEQQKVHMVDKRELEIASKKFVGRGSMKADGAGGWKLKGMRSSLHHYQLLGAAFMRDLENRNKKPFGGFVSDEMGLGKTVMAICNMIDGSPSTHHKAKATLVVAPSSLLTQWMSEIDRHTEPGRLGRVMLYRSGSRLIVNDIESEFNTVGVVLTSYHEVLRSFPKNDPPAQYCTEEAKNEWWTRELKTGLGALHRVEWRRIIVDEAQAIKNHKSRTSQAVCHLKSKYRWAISGTPIQNRLEEFYAFFRFLELPHTGSYDTFRANFCKHDSELAIKRLRNYLDQFMLRRTHADQIFGRPILKLPSIDSVTIPVEFSSLEKVIYKVVKDRFVQKIKAFVQKGSPEKKYQSIFVLLLRLRQLTCHCFLVQDTFKELLEEADLQRLWKLTDNESDVGNLQMIQGLRFTLGNATVDRPQPPNKPDTDGPITFRFRKYLQSMRDDGKWREIADKTMCTACKEPPTEPQITSCMHIYCFACLNQLSWNAAMDIDPKGSQCLECGIHFDRTERCSRDDLMSPERESPFSSVPKQVTKEPEDSMDWLKLPGPILQSAKTRAAVLQIEQWRQEDSNAKIIVFTQFRGMIRVMKRVCDERGWQCTPFHGGMSFEARDKAVKSFTENPECFVMLCGMKAGGVGLNLTAANRVIIIDLWWNQFVETQAFCRVYRIGQGSGVKMVRFVVKDSVDEEILAMQERKNVEIEQAINSQNRLGRLSVKELLQLFAVDLEKDENGEPITGPNDAPFIFTDDPYQQTSYIEDLSE